MDEASWYQARLTAVSQTSLLTLVYQILAEIRITTMRAITVALSLLPICISALNQNGSSTYFSPNSTGFRMRNGFETVLVQPFGYDGIRVRAWAFRPPNGNEISFLYDPPLEGPEDGNARGMSFDTQVNGSQFVALRNGNIVVKTLGGSYGQNSRLAFFRIESNGSETLLTNEYSPKKSKNPRYS